MSAITGQSGAEQGNIMIVDDNPANLKLLEDMLRLHGYEVRSFPRGRLALAAANQEPPELILLDINMPEMNGYEVCALLKADTKLSAIPVIFLSALDAVADKVKGFQSGGVDYISKPIQFEEVQARVETHLKLRRAQQAEHELLDRTLNAAVGTLWELVQLSSPLLALRSQTIREIVHWITKRIPVSDPWQCELAATLSLAGCVALPEDVFERGYTGQKLSPDEDRMFRAHPQRAARLVANIPRLEVVAEIIRGQQDPQTKPAIIEQAKQGALILNLALELDRRIYRGMTCGSALEELQRLRRFDARLLEALESYWPAKAEFQTRRLPIRELRADMILQQDVLTDAGLLILKTGTTLTTTWIERLENFSKARGAPELIDVLIRANVNMPKLTELKDDISGAG